MPEMTLIMFCSDKCVVSAESLDLYLLRAKHTLQFRLGMFAVIYSILALNGVCVVAGGSDAPIQFIPAACTVGPQWTCTPAYR